LNFSFACTCLQKLYIIYKRSYKMGSMTLFNSQFHSRLLWWRSLDLILTTKNCFYTCCSCKCFKIYDFQIKFLYPFAAYLIWKWSLCVICFNISRKPMASTHIMIWLILRLCCASIDHTFLFWYTLANCQCLY
jgi:hypothetical protein